MNGAGAVNETVRAFRRTERARSARREGRKLVRRAARRARSTDKATIPEEDGAPFPCYRLCLECRVLLPPRSPMEDARGIGTALHHCSRCGGASVIDLRSDAATQSLADLDAFERSARLPRALRRWRRLGMVTTAASISAAMLTMFYMVAAHAHGVRDLFGLFGGIASVFTLSYVLREVFARWRRMAGKALPARWSMVLPGRGSQRIGGVGRVHGELLRAPLSGRPCLAYEVGVRRDRRPDGDLGSWLLLEQRIAPGLHVDGHAVDPAQLSLALDRTLLPKQAASPDGLRVYFRERGLPSSETLQVYETVVPSGGTLRGWLTTPEFRRSTRTNWPPNE